MLNIKGKDNYYEDRIVPSSDTEVLSIIRNITDEKKNSSELRKMEKIFSIISLFAEKIYKGGINNTSVEYMLSELGKAFNLSRAYIFKKTGDSDKEITVKQLFEWCGDNIISSAEVLDLETFSIPKGTK